MCDRKELGEEHRATGVVAIRHAFVFGGVQAGAEWVGGAL